MNKLVGPKQIKAARALLGWSQEELAKCSDLSKPTIARLEKSISLEKHPYKTISSIFSAFTLHGIIFINQDDVTGVSIKK